MMFLGSKHCPRCGASAATPETRTADGRACPRCRKQLAAAKIGATEMLECEDCLGVWLDVTSFEKICADREQQSAVLGFAAEVPKHEIRETNKINYVPCPECSQLMNRMNFARCSGVIVDICKQHGTWFDRDELSRIVEFIHGGGLEASRQREKEEIKEERRRLTEQQKAAETETTLRFGQYDHEHRLAGIASTRGLLKFLLDG